MTRKAFYEKRSAKSVLQKVFHEKRSTKSVIQKALPKVKT